MSVRDNTLVRYFLQATGYAAFIAVIGYFSTSPAIQVISSDESVITMAFAHAGKTRKSCHRLSQEELMKLAPNMRKAEDCPRERSPIVIEMLLDGEPIYSETFQPPGLFKDGSVDIYFSKRVPVGRHLLAIKMDDSVRTPGFDHVFEQEVSLQPAHILLVSFEPLGGFSVRQ